MHFLSWGFKLIQPMHGHSGTAVRFQMTQVYKAFKKNLISGEIPNEKKNNLQ